MSGLVRGFIEDKRGATSIEYGLIGAIISIVAVAALTRIGVNLGGKFSNVSAALN